MSDEEYAARVVMDWMERARNWARRLKKPKIRRLSRRLKPTRAAKSLVHTVNRAVNEDDLVLVIGREHLEAAKWGHGDWNFDNLPQVPLSEGFKINRGAVGLMSGETPEEAPVDDVPQEEPLPKNQRSRKRQRSRKKSETRLKWHSNVPNLPEKEIAYKEAEIPKRA